MACQWLRPRSSGALRSTKSLSLPRKHASPWPLSAPGALPSSAISSEIAKSLPPAEAHARPGLLHLPSAPKQPKRLEWHAAPPA